MYIVIYIYSIFECRVVLVVVRAQGIQSGSSCLEQRLPFVLSGLLETYLLLDSLRSLTYQISAPRDIYMPGGLRSLDPGRGPVHESRLRLSPQRVVDTPPQLLTRSASNSDALQHFPPSHPANRRPSPPQNNIGPRLINMNGSLRSRQQFAAMDDGSALPVPNAYRSPAGGMNFGGSVREGKGMLELTVVSRDDISMDHGTGVPPGRGGSMMGAAREGTTRSGPQRGVMGPKGNNAGKGSPTTSLSSIYRTQISNFSGSRGPGAGHPLRDQQGNKRSPSLTSSFGTRGTQALLQASRLARAQGGGDIAPHGSSTNSQPAQHQESKLPSAITSSSPSAPIASPAPVSSTPYDFRVVLSSGKVSHRKIELMTGSGSTQGLRPTMEDEHFCKLYSATVRESPVSLLGILDGHCGRRVAEMASRYLPEFFFSHKSLGDNNALAMVETIMQADQAIYKGLRGEGASSNASWTNTGRFVDGTPSGGSTLICAAIHGRMLYVGCLGDARAVLLDGKTTIAMSEDHKPANDKEHKRIQRCGGFVQYGRVCGILAVSRALGDFEFKHGPSGNRGTNGVRPSILSNGGSGHLQSSSPGSSSSSFSVSTNAGDAAKEFMVSNVADVRQISLTDESQFLILACDGLWDVLSNEEATQFVKDFLSYTPEVNDTLVLTGQRPRPSSNVIQRILNSCSQKLAEFAVDRGSTDNVSVVILFFHDVVETVVGFSEAPPPGQLHGTRRQQPLSNRSTVANPSGGGYVLPYKKASQQPARTSWMSNSIGRQSSSFSGSLTNRNRPLW